MDKLFAMKVFVVVEAQNSFVLAAEALSISAPAATRAVSWLEQSLDTKLFHRTTRRIRLTEAKQSVLGGCKTDIGGHRTCRSADNGYSL
ncbi:helix-turn-helix domain-containing protein [Alteromonas gracilis]|uniref:helix-turn-helix domain-containing protein n=1 Tax=Alteromonas gracilis TaxID=1479524 RepID=UPI0030CB86CA